MAVSARHGPRSHGGYLLKLSGPVLDLAPVASVGEAQRAQLREARALLEGDDFTSQMLALRARIDTLQKQVAQLQALATRLDASKPDTAAAIAQGPAQPSRARRIADAAWSWALVALLGLLALLWPLSRVLRGRRRDEVAELVVKPGAAPKGVETGRFVAPPPEVLAPDAVVSAPATPSGPAAIDDTEEAIRNARDLYNAGERLQAAGVLRLAIESHPERVAPWLPLFDLLMRERLATEFAELARGFRALHGASPAWKTVQRAGQQIDPANPLYQDEHSPHQAAA
jgi:hypothetical protein